MEAESNVGWIVPFLIAMCSIRYVSIFQPCHLAGSTMYKGLSGYAANARAGTSTSNRWNFLKLEAIWVFMGKSEPWLHAKMLFVWQATDAVHSFGYSGTRRTCWGSTMKLGPSWISSPAYWPTQRLPSSLRITPSHGATLTARLLHGTLRCTVCPYLPSTLYFADDWTFRQKNLCFVVCRRIIFRCAYYRPSAKMRLLAFCGLEWTSVEWTAARRAFQLAWRWVICRLPSSPRSKKILMQVCALYAIKRW